MGPYREVFMAEMLPKVTTAALPMLGAAAVFLLLVGRASLGRLRETGEDLPHRAELIWGARWYWLVISGTILAVIGGAMAGVRWSAYPVTFAVAGALSIVPVTMIVDRLMPHRSTGQWVAFMVAGHRRKQDGLTVGEIIGRERHKARAVWLRVVAVIPAIGYVGLIVWAGMRTVPLDRDLMRYERADAMAAVVQERISRPSVEAVTVGLDGMLPDRPGSMVVVRARQGTSAEELDAIVAAVGGFIPGIGGAGQWDVRAYVRDGPHARRTFEVR